MSIIATAALIKAILFPITILGRYLVAEIIVEIMSIVKGP